MRQSVKFSLENLKFDRLMEFLDGQFQLFPDGRASNAKYPLASIVKAAFAMFSLKSPSLLNFKRQTLPEQNNLRSIYRIDGAIPCDNQMRKVWDVLEPSRIRPVFSLLFGLLKRAGVIKEYWFWKKLILV